MEKLYLIGWRTPGKSELNGEHLDLQLEKVLSVVKFGLPLKFHLVTFPLDPFHRFGTGSGPSVPENRCEHQQRSQLQIERTGQVNRVGVGKGRERKEEEGGSRVHMEEESRDEEPSCNGKKDPCPSSFKAQPDKLL